MTRDDWRWLVIAMALPAIVCAWRLNLPLWADEVYTLVHFASQPVSGIVTDYSAPNNHILFTLLIRPVYLIAKSEFFLRMPTLLISLATLLLVFRFACLWLGRAAAVWATLLLGMNVMFLVHAMQLRGYGLSMLLAAALPNCVPVPSSPTSRSTWLRGLAIALLGAALLYTLPTNALFLAPLTIWATFVAWSRTSSWKQVAVSLLPWLAGWLLAVLLYSPVYQQLASQTATSGPINVFPLLADVWRAIGYDVWPLWLLAPLGLVFWWKRARAPSGSGRYEFPLLIALMLVLPFALCAALGISPFVRNFCPLLPFVALATAWLMDELRLALMQRISASRSRRHQRRLAASPDTGHGILVAGAVIVLVLLVPAVWLYPARLERVRSQRIAHDGYYNYYAARFDPVCAALTLREQVDPNETYLICYADSDHYDLVYQLGRVGFPIPPLHIAGENNQGPLFVVVPPLPDYDDIARICNVSPAELARYTQIADCGYFRVLRSPTPHRLTPHNSQ